MGRAVAGRGQRVALVQRRLGPRTTLIRASEEVWAFVSQFERGHRGHGQNPARRVLKRVGPIASG